jgi:hypothetical protein
MPTSETRCWDTRVLFVERTGRWWWNAWDRVGEVERSGYAATRDEARAALAEAVGPGPS